jgi:outer membrane lipoprotein-sorting protein
VFTDVDADADLDLIVTNGSSVVVMDNDGTGALAARPPMYVTGGLDALLVADVDADGDPDLVVALDETSTQQTVRFLLNDGTGAFPLRKRLMTGFSSRHLAAGDLDGDTVPDIVVGKPQFAAVLVLASRP